VRRLASMSRATLACFTNVGGTETSSPLPFFVPRRATFCSLARETFEKRVKRSSADSKNSTRLSRDVPSARRAVCYSLRGGAPRRKRMSEFYS
jgi:hypothetical protein